MSDDFNCEYFITNRRLFQVNDRLHCREANVEKAKNNMAKNTLPIIFFLRYNLTLFLAAQGDLKR